MRILTSICIIILSITVAEAQQLRTSTSHKEPIDINALADEYLRLTYHGLKAKDKIFNAAIQTDYDKSIGKINIIPRDVGSVLLNRYNSAFYAVNEKGPKNIDGYEPTVSISKKKTNDKVVIHVNDSGNGIPQNFIDKVFPFLPINHLDKAQA